MAVELGAAYISILPSTTKLAAGVAGEFSKIEGDAKAAGAKIGSALAGSLKPLDVEINTPSIPTPDAPDIPDADTGSFASSLKSAMGPIGAIAGGVLGVAIVGGLKAAMDREVGTDTLQAQMGLGPREAARLGRLAGDLYVGNYAESVTQGSDALRDILTFIPGMEDASAARLEGFAQNLLSQAAITGEDPRRIAQVVGQMMKTGMVGGAGEALDYLTKGFQEGLNKDDDLLDTINEYSTSFRTWGLDMDDVFTLLRQGAEGGVRDTDMLADAIKESSLLAIEPLTEVETVTVKGVATMVPKLSALGAAFEAAGVEVIDSQGKITESGRKFQEDLAGGGAPARAALDRLLEGVGEIESAVQRRLTAKALFGTPGEDMAGAFNKLDLGPAKQELGSVKGAANRATEAFGDNALGDLTSFYRGIKTKVVDVIVAVALPALKDLTRYLADRVGPAIDRAVDFARKGEWSKAWGELKPIVQEIWAWVVEKSKVWGDKLAVVGERIGKKIGAAVVAGITGAVQDYFSSDVTESEGAATTLTRSSGRGNTQVPTPVPLNLPAYPSGTGDPSPGRGTTDNRMIVNTMNVNDWAALLRRRAAAARRANLNGGR